jgi:hypothetical protein
MLDPQHAQYSNTHMSGNSMVPDWTGEDCHAYFEVLNQGCRDQCYPFTGLKVVNERLYV